MAPTYNEVSPEMDVMHKRMKGKMCALGKSGAKCTLHQLACLRSTSIESLTWDYAEMIYAFCDEWFHIGGKLFGDGHRLEICFS